MSVAIGDIGQTAVVLAGGVFVLTDGLFEVGVAGLVFGVDGNIVIPRRAVNGGHGQTYEEGIAGGGHIFRDSGFYNQIQSLLHIGSRSVAGGIRFGHSHTAVLDSSFQSIFHVRRIGSQCGGQLVVQGIRREIADAALGLVSVRGGQADGGQHGVGALRVVEAKQHTDRALTVHDFIVHGNVSDAEVGELHALNGVFAQLIHDGVIMQTGGKIRFSVPHAVLAGLGDVIFIDTQGCFLRRINGRFCGKCRSNETQGHNGGHEHGEYAMDLFHLVVSFVNSDFLQK